MYVKIPETMAKFFPLSRLESYQRINPDTSSAPQPSKRKRQASHNKATTVCPQFEALEIFT